MGDNMKAALCCNAIDNAYKETGTKRELLYIVMLVNALITQEWKGVPPSELKITVLC